MMDVMTRTQDAPGSEPVAGTALDAVEELVRDGFLDDLMARVDEGGLQLTGEGGFLPELVKRVLEAGLQAELTDHLGYEKHDRTGTGASRAVRFQESQLLADCRNICATMGIGPADVNFGVIPFSHSYGFSNLITPLLYQGPAWSVQPIECHERSITICRAVEQPSFLERRRYFRR